ncbi:hypothetical protein PNOK_0253600 [Pyrrhoderma noxium]|uniref:C2H2-type domain-containing protein n=1 Tax=Pyrrhoderma noxium TaxID=2282107 RepID=A0A286USN1_9AGAM|nr:hypothetical protein PNOK_0253600 [Pyrrhoderma noxium]
MVRAYIKQPSEEKTASKRKGSSAKESTLPSEFPLGPQWPCKLDGCKLRFQREADLKRHQRTAKVHGTSGAIPCPQCDACFTRGDALKRHQKSRCAQSQKPKTALVADARGKKGTPSSVRSSSVETTSKKESEVTSTIINTTPTTLPVQTIMVRPENPTTSIGQQSYYRQTTASSGAYYYPASQNIMSGTFHTILCPRAYYRSAQVNPAPQNSATQINDEPKATEIDIPPSDAQNGTCEHDGLKGSKIEEEKHVDLVTYDIDVEKIVQAVLSIEPKSTEGDMTSSLSTSTAVASEVPIDSSYDNDKDLGTDLDADGEADPDGEGEYQEEEGSLPDGIKELINEDSLI